MVAKKVTTPAETVEPIPKSNTIKVETANGIYELKKPGGKLGGLHFRLLTKAMPKNSLQEEGIDNPGMSPADQERLQEVFVDWTEQVLPNILISHDYEDVPGEDQWVLYLASFQMMNVSGELFRIIR